MNQPFESHSNQVDRRSRPLSPFLVLFLTCAAFFAFGLVAQSILNQPAQDTAAAPVEPAPIAADAPLEQVAPEPAAVQAPDEWRSGDFDGNRIFFHKLTDVGVQSGRVQQIIDTLTPVYDFRRSHPNHRWRVGFRDGEAVAFTLKVSPSQIYDITDLDSEPSLAQREIETFSSVEVVSGEINGSLLQSLQGTPDSLQLALKMANEVFAWDIDFYKDPRAGDRFDILVLKNFIQDDEGPLFIGYGDILAARYQGDCGNYEAFQYSYEDEQGYFNTAGESLIRDFLRSPLKLQRVTSSFRKRRFHPVLKRYKAHNGIDYGAAPNTPVMAVASGRVKRAGRYGGAGIAVELNHRNQMMTQYFHLNKIAAGVKPGAKVKQGQVIGYVGKTGLANGYHLHFGMKIRGQYVDPMRQKFKPGKPIPTPHMDDFRRQVNQYLSLIQDGGDTPEAIVRVPTFLEASIQNARL